MMGYKDMTFCRGAGCADFHKCPRALNERVLAGAKRWWGNDDAPICQYSNPEALPCYVAGPEDQLLQNLQQLKTQEVKP